jgi:WD40 repeat protein
MIRTAAVFIVLTGFTVLTALADEPLPPQALHRLGSAQFQMGTTVVSAGYTSDGKAVFTGTQSGLVVKTDVATGKELGRLQLQRYNGRSMLFSPDGATVVALGYDNLIRIVDFATGKDTCEPISHPHGINTTAWLSPNKTFAAAGEGILRIFNLEGHELKSWKAPVHVQCAIACSPDGKWIATATSRTGDVQLWDCEAGELTRTMQRFGQRASSRTGNLAFSPDGKLLVQATHSREIPIWETETGNLRQKLGKQSEPVNALSVGFGADGKFVVVAGTNRSLQLWGLASGERLRYAEGFELGTSLAVSPDGKTAVACGQGPALRLFDLEKMGLRHSDSGHRGPIRDLVFLDRGKRLATFGMDNLVCFWDTAAGKELDRFKPQPGIQIFGRASDGVSIRFSDRGKLVYTRKPDGTLEEREFDLAVRGSVARMSADGRWIASVMTAPREVPERVARTLSLKNNLWLFDLESGEVRSIDLTNSPLYFLNLAFSHDGRVLAAPGDKVIQAWDTRTGARMLSIRLGEHTQRVTRHWTISPDYRTAVICDHAGQVSVIESSSGLVRLKIPKPNERNAMCMALSPDGRYLAVSLYPPAGIRIYDLATGAEAGPFNAHAGYVQQLAFSPDGKLLASAGTDTTAVLWDMSRMRPSAAAASEPTAAELESLWTRLSGDGESAHRAIWLLSASPKAAAFIAAKLSDNAAPKLRPLADLITELDHDKFAVREKATRDLRAWGELARLELMKARGNSPSAEKARRIDQLLKDLGQELPLAQIRSLRALEVLERLGTPEARKVVERLTKDADAGVADDAKRALERMAK